MILGEFIRMYCGGIRIGLSIPMGEYDEMHITTDRDQLVDSIVQQHFSWMLDCEVKEFTITEDLNDEMTLFISLKRKEV